MDITAVLYSILALGGAGALLGAALSFAHLKFYVPEAAEDGLKKICEALPGVNCGACGYASCEAYADAVFAGAARPNLCLPGGKKSAECIAAALGIEAGSKP